jgi:hypothetical protein
MRTSLNSLRLITIVLPLALMLLTACNGTSNTSITESTAPVPESTETAGKLTEAAPTQTPAGDAGQSAPTISLDLAIWQRI